MESEKILRKIDLVEIGDGNEPLELHVGTPICNSGHDVYASTVLNVPGVYSGHVVRIMHSQSNS